MDGVETGVQADAAAPATPPAAPAPAAGARTRGRKPRTPRTRRSLAFDLGALVVIGGVLAGALVATGAVLYDQLYSPQAYVERYLNMLSDGRAVDALALPGVPVSTLDSNLPATASEALLRHDALGPLADYEVEEASTSDGVTSVTVSYSLGSYDGQSTFLVEPNGWIGLAPAWRFAESPLALIDLDVRGSMEFSVNGFEIDKRQISPDGADADPLAPVSMLVFSPGMYSVSVSTPISQSPGAAVVSDTPGARVPVSVQTTPTPEFVAVVQEKVDAFLRECATQEVLQPTGCPFGYYVQNRVNTLPAWSIAKDPTIALEPDGAHWKIARTDGAAQIEVDIRSIYDGSISEVSEEVPFTITGTVTILPDGSASIQVAAG